MEAPNKIYIQPNAHDRWWEGDKPNDNFQEYINKDILIKYLRTEIDKYLADSENTIGIYPYSIETVINIIQNI